MGVLLVFVALLVVMATSELALRGTKLQTGLGRVLVVWAGIYVLALYPVMTLGQIGWVPLTIFWGGAFLSWFGVRSHIESSILLRMLYLLRKRPLSESELVHEYTTHYGQDMRLQELFRGKLAESGLKPSVTAKGKSILRIVDLLR